MKKIFSRLPKSLLWALGGCLATLIAQCATVLLCLPKGGMYYQGMPLLSTLPPLLAILSAAPVMALSIRSKEPSRLSQNGNTVCWSLLLRIPALCPMAVVLIPLILESRLSALTGVLPVLALLSCLYPLFAALPALRKYRLLMALFALAATLTPILLVAILYFDTSSEMNAPLKIYMMIAVAALPLLPLYELRETLTGQPVKALFPLQVLILALSALAVPALLAGLTGRCPYLFLTISAITPLLYSVSLVWQMMTLPSQAEPPISPVSEPLSESERNDL